MTERSRHAPRWHVSCWPRFSDAGAAVAALAFGVRRRLTIALIGACVAAPSRRRPPARMFLRTSAPTRAAPRRPCAASAARRRVVVATARPANATAISSARIRDASRPRPRPTAGRDGGARRRRRRVRAARSIPGPCEAAFPVFAFVDGVVRAADLRWLPGQRQPASGTLEECLARAWAAGPERLRGRPGRARDLRQLRSRRRLRQDANALRAPSATADGGSCRLRRLVTPVVTEGVCQVGFCI